MSCAWLQAHRYPDEFNGIIAGDPANVRRNAWALWLAVQTFKDSDAYIPPEKYPMIHRAVLDACDANDGLKDGLIEDPESCHFDFKALQCMAADGPDCLTPRQVHTAQTITSPATTRTGKVLFPRLEPGTELDWARLAGGPSPADLFLDSSAMLCTRIQNGTGGPSTLSATLPRRTQSIRTSTISIPTLPPSPSTAASYSSFTGGLISRWRRAPALNSTNRSSLSAQIPNKLRTGSDSSWFPGWGTA